MMKDVNFFMRMSKEGKTVFAKTRNTICNIMSADNVCFDDMDRTEGQGILFNSHSKLGERFVFAEKSCWMYLHHSLNDIETIDKKFIALKDELTLYNLTKSKVLDVPPLNGESGLYYLKISYEKLAPKP